MDMETFEIFYAPSPKDEDVRGKLASGHEVEYWKVMDRIMIMRVKGTT
jgi:translation initiation factor 5A